MAVAQRDIGATGSSAAGLPVEGIGTRRLAMWLAVAGWASLVAMWTTGSADAFGHELEGVSTILGIGLFLVGWIVMVAAMMLPSSLPTLRRADHVLVDETAMAAPRFVLGFFLMWSVFGAAAFVGDGILHLSVANMPWLAERPSLILGAVAMFAGAAEALGRPSPPGFPSAATSRGAFSLGREHAVDRIRRCWPLMLFAMAIGMGSAFWMVALTLLMTLELRPAAAAGLRLIGVALFALGLAVVIEPGWMPVLLASA